MTLRLVNTLNELYSGDCDEVAELLLRELEAGKQTKVEKQLFSEKHKASVNQKLEMAIEELSETSKSLANKARDSARKRSRKGAEALTLSLASIKSPKMLNFLKGPWKKITGRRGLSEPFVKIRVRSAHSLMIEHAGDEFAMLIEWKEIEDIKPVIHTKRHGRQCAVLSLPKNLSSRAEMNQLQPQIFELIAGSYFQPYISAMQCPIKKVAALLHDRKLFCNRPGQNQFVELLRKLHNHSAFARAVRSMLFIAPTGAGKTRILGLAAIERIARFKALLQGLASTRVKQKNVCMLVTQDPRLVDQLAQDIGPQIADVYREEDFRIVQWGGSRSENMPFEEFLGEFIQSNIPVVLITSSQSLCMRVKRDSLKELLKRTNLVAMDEAHHSDQPSFKRLLRAADQQAVNDRRSQESHPLPLTVLGVTATPIHKNNRPIDIFQHSFWSLVDSTERFSKEVLSKAKRIVREEAYKRVPLQLVMAKHLGEIVAPMHPHFVDPEEVRKGLRSIFEVVRTERGGHVGYVNKQLMRDVWKYVRPLLQNKGQGVVDCYPRDAVRVAKGLSTASRKNFVALDNKLPASERNKIIECFRSRQPYEGRQIYALVGPMGEGFDFPFIGWYISMKKYVRFREVYQGPGRAYRLSLGKKIPSVIFFGQALEDDVA